MDSMARARKAEWILMLAAPPDRARGLAAEIAAANAGRPPAQFWSSVMRAVLRTVIGQLRASPRCMAGMVAGAFATGLLLGTAFQFVPDWLVHRPDDQSWLSSPWLKQTAQACSSVFGLWIWRSIVGPLLLGSCVALLSHGREILSFLAVVISQFVAGQAAPMYAAHLGFLSLATVVIDSAWNYLVVLLGAVLVRRSFLWKSNRPA